MNIREMLEQREQKFLSSHAALSVKTAGRAVWEESCDVRTDFQRDRDRILHCKSFRRLKHKTQVFIAPENDHFRTRLTHTLEVSQISRTIAKALCLNEDLTEAIALGHDLGHTPFGHSGERALRSLSPDGFKHNEQSLRVVDVLEKNGEGLNLTAEVRDGILNHRLSCHPVTLEGNIVRLSDKIAYISHDLDDAIQAGIITEQDIPKEYTDVLGNTVTKRLNTMIQDMIFSSLDKNEITISSEVFDVMIATRKWLFEHVYSICVPEDREKKIQDIIECLYEYHRHDYDDRTTCDWISGMTDQYAIDKYNSITGNKKSVLF